jgi:hypothetical protein
MSSHVGTRFNTQNTNRNRRKTDVVIDPDHHGHWITFAFGCELFVGETTGELTGADGFFVSLALGGSESSFGGATTGASAVSTISGSALTSVELARDVANGRHLRGFVGTAAFTGSFTMAGGASATTLLPGSGDCAGTRSAAAGGSETCAGAATGVTGAGAAAASVAGTSDIGAPPFKNITAPITRPTITNAATGITNPPFIELIRTINADRASKFLGAS